MAKKKFATNEEQATPEQDTAEPKNVGQLDVKLSSATETPKVSNLPPRKPGLVAVEMDSGIGYKFTRMKLPKRSGKQPEGEFKLDINGVETPVWTTSNRMWAKDEATTLDYIWFSIPEDDGPAEGYITLDYAVEAKSFADKSFSVGVGTTERKDPDRLGKLDESGQPKDLKRVAAFQDAMAKKKAAAEAAATTEAAPATESPEQQPAA